MLDGYARCNNCTRRNRKDCDGVFSEAEFEALTAKRNRLAEAARQKGEEIRQKSEEMQRLLSSIAQANAERERFEREAEQLLEKQKKMVIQEANALDALDHADPPPQASSTVLVGLDDAQLEDFFELAPGSMANFLGPIPLDHPFIQ
jgi:chromosome segregation ATPase